MVGPTRLFAGASVLALSRHALSAPTVDTIDLLSTRATDIFDEAIDPRDAEAIDAIIASDFSLDETSLNPRGAAKASWPLIGVNECGLEYGDKQIPGQLGTDYFLPEISSINQFFQVGHNVVRIPFLMERLLNSRTINGIFHNSDYLWQITHLVNQITSQRKFAVIVPLNYGLFHKDLITDKRGFGEFWKALAGKFAGNHRVMFDVMNEWHDEPMQLVYDLSQAAINGIRASGATTQSIWIEISCWNNALSYENCRGTDGKSNDILADLNDPQHNLLYSVHVYMDQDDTGHWLDDCAEKEPLVGVHHLRPPNSWLKRHNKFGIIGELGARPTKICNRAVKNALTYIKKQGDLYKGVLWWNAGSHTQGQSSTIEPGTSGFDMYARLLATF